MRNVYVCSCFQKDFYNKTYDEILHNVFMNPSDYSIFVRIEIETDLYICCPQIIEFCYKTNRWYFFNKTCSNQMAGLTVSCISLLKFGFRSICKVCVCPLQVKLFPFLIKVK